MISPQTKDIDIVSLLKDKQEQVIPLALSEMYLNSRPKSAWVWWTFPSNITLVNQPEPLIYLTSNTVLLYLNSYPLEWKYLMLRIYKTIHYLRKPMVAIFTDKSHQKYIKISIKFLLQALEKIDDPDVAWLYNCLRFFKKNFNNFF